MCISYFVIFFALKSWPVFILFLLLATSTGGYVFAYAILFFSTKLDLADFVSGALYFGYMGIISSLFALLTGTIGFEACFWFNCKIFGAIKID